LAVTSCALSKKDVFEIGKVDTDYFTHFDFSLRGGAEGPSTWQCVDPCHYACLYPPSPAMPSFVVHSFTHVHPHAMPLLRSIPLSGPPGHVFSWLSTTLLTHVFTPSSTISFGPSDIMPCLSHILFQDCHRRCSESLDCSDCCVKSSTIELKSQEVFLRPYTDAWKTVSATGSREGKQWIGRMTRDSTCRLWASEEAPIY
jgi:hypothetical protein